MKTMWKKYVGAGIGYFFAGAPGAILGFFITRQFIKNHNPLISDPDLESCYKILNIPYDATPADIKRAYRDMVKRFHPDANQGTKGHNTYHQKMAIINEAYQRLRKVKNF